MKTKFLLILFCILTSIQIQAARTKVLDNKKQEFTDKEIIEEPRLEKLNVEILEMVTNLRDLTNGDVKPISLTAAIELVILSYPDKFGVNFNPFWNPSVVIKHDNWCSTASAHARWYIQNEGLTAPASIELVILDYPGIFGVDFGPFWNPSSEIIVDNKVITAYKYARSYIKGMGFTAHNAVSRVIKEQLSKNIYQGTF